MTSRNREEYVAVRYLTPQLHSLFAAWCYAWRGLVFVVIRRAPARTLCQPSPGFTGPPWTSDVPANFRGAPCLGSRSLSYMRDSFQGASSMDLLDFT